MKSILHRWLFRLWWRRFRHTGGLPPPLFTMVDAFVESPDYEHVSLYWLHLNRIHLRQIADAGLSNFRQTLAQQYFTLARIDWADAAHLVLRAQRSVHALPYAELFRKHRSLSPDASISYNIMTACLYELVNERGGRPLLALLRDSDLGNPPILHLDGLEVTQDKLNGVLEFLSLSELTDPYRLSRVLEIGAGSGRTAACMLSLNPTLRYIIVDIPPALYVSSEYLRSVFPSKVFFEFRPFSRFADVRDALLSADVVFLSPQQMQLLPDGFVDLFLAIDCLHEMTPTQIKGAFDAADRLASCCYFTCMPESIVPFDRYTYRRESYPVPPEWHEVFVRDREYPATYFEGAFRVPPRPGAA